MRARVITLRYDDGLGGFPEEALHRALSGQEVLEVREHFFVHAGKPHLALMCLLGDGAGKARPREFDPALDPAHELPSHLLGLYRALRQWRNDKARAEGIPSYLILRNRQIADICRILPRSLAGLREVEGVGEATCSKYSAEILAMIPEEAGQESSPSAGSSPAPA